MKIMYQERHVTALCQGRSVQLDYLLFSELGQDKLQRYGIRLELLDQGKQTHKEIRDITTDGYRAAELLELLWRHTVTPATVLEILDELL